MRSVLLLKLGQFAPRREGAGLGKAGMTSETQSYKQRQTSMNMPALKRPIFDDTAPRAAEPQRLAHTSSGSSYY